MANDDILISISEEPDATLRILGEYIGSAYSPQVEVTETQTGHDVAITYDDADEGITTTTFSVEDGEDGADGFSPTLSSSAVTGGHRVSMTDATGTKTFDVMDGLDGADGYSPSVKVMQGDGSATITITDKDGTTTAAVHDGADGQDGRDGADGADGFSPTATVTQTASGATITVTDQSGTTTADISNGAPGEPGQTGPIGPTGEDGFSPTVDVEEIEGGHEVTITDADGPHSFDVMDGDPATPGSITDEMLAPDGIKPQVAQLWGNQLTGELSGTIDTADDAYAAPPMALTVEGASTQAGTPMPDAPVPILSVDSVTLACSGKNRLNTNNLVDGKYLSATGVVGNESGMCYTDDYSPITQGTYTLSLIRGSASKNYRLHGYDSEKQWVRQVWWNSVSSGTGLFTATINVPDGIAYLRLSFADTASDVQLELGSTATAYEPYQGTTVPLYDGTLRSLPDGTCDTLNLSYLRPSTRAGWAWYSRELVQRTGVIVGDNLVKYNASNGFFAYNATAAKTLPTRCRCSWTNTSESFNSSNMTKECVQFPTTTADMIYVAALADRSLDDFEFDYPLATPVTTTFDPIELPVLPAPTATVWCDGGSAQPTFVMEYVRDTTIVIQQLEAAIADLATS